MNASPQPVLPVPAQPAAPKKARLRCDCNKPIPHHARNYRGRITMVDMVRPAVKGHRPLGTVVLAVTKRADICAACVRELLTNAIPYLLER